MGTLNGALGGKRLTLSRLQKTTTAPLQTGCILLNLNARGERIRTSDSPLPNRSEGKLQIIDNRMVRINRLPPKRQTLVVIY